MLNSLVTKKEGTPMKFNNFLNRLGIKKMYALLLLLLILVILFIYFLVRFIFHVEEPKQRFDRYMISLQNQNFHDASSSIISDERATWAEKFSEYALDESALRALYFHFWSKSSWELVSSSALSDEHHALRLQITAPDAEAILREVREMAESGRIDMTDREIVRSAPDQASALYYYVIDHYEDLETPYVQDQVIVNFHLEGSFTAKTWKLQPTDALHDLFSGYVQESAEEVFRRPLDIPKS